MDKLYYMGIELIMTQPAQEMKDFVLYSMNRAQEQASDDTIDEHMDIRLAGIISYVMTDKLAKKRDEGRGGWYDKDTCSLEYLDKLLHEHIDKGDMIDIINLAAMIYVREIMDAPEESQF